MATIIEVNEVIKELARLYRDSIDDYAERLDAAYCEMQSGEQLSSVDYPLWDEMRVEMIKFFDCNNGIDEEVAEIVSEQFNNFDGNTDINKWIV